MAKQNKGKQANKKKKQANQPMQTSQTSTNLTPKGMVKDVDALYLGDKNWSHAINAINNSVDGDTGVIGNEPANLHCANVPYRIIGGIHLYGDRWALFSTDNYNSEIGLFDDSQCEYTMLVNDACLHFNQDNLIIGASKENFDCTWQIYWDDGLNPSRTLNLDNIPWIQVQTSAEGASCVIFEDTSALDCEKIRLAPWIDIPCIKLSKAPEGGQLNNGSYQIYLAYLVNDKQIGDYVGISNIQPIWSHENTSGSIDIKLANLDTEFEYYKLVVAFAHEGSVVAKKLGVYTTQQTTINIDYINPSLADVPIMDLPRRGEAYEKSKGMYVVNDVLIRSNPVEQFDFNYQPIANNIRAKWVSVKYPADYYRKGGNKPTFLRDEQYAFFIRFIYNTGERSSSYHIPGRPPEEVLINGVSVFENDMMDTDANVLNVETERYFEGYNTATSESEFYTNSLNEQTDDGGEIIGIGAMGYWESTERYPALDPVRWNTNDHVYNGDVSLCGEPIRHHKMPDESLPTGECALSSGTGQYIHILGVHFENISPPLDNDGEVIANIQGFEILTGSRVGNKSIIAKGIIRNMMEYDSVDGNGEESTGEVRNYMANYPYNSRLEDPYLIRPNTGNSVSSIPFLEDITPADNWLSGEWNGFNTDADIKSFHHASAGDYDEDNVSRSLNTFSNEMFTFHSPETQFERVYLNARELRVYDKISGIATGHFTKSEGHPQHKILKDWMALVAIIAGVGYAIYQMKGRRKQRLESMQSYSQGLVGNMLYGSGYWAAPMPGAGTVLSLANVATDGLGSVAQAAADYAAEGAVNAAIVLGGGNWQRAAKLTAFGAAEAGKAALTAGHIGPKNTQSYEGTKFSQTPDLIGWITGITTFMTHTATGGQELIDLLLNVMSYQDYTWKYNSHGFFNTSNNVVGIHRYDIHKNMYVGANLQNMDSTIRVNNMHRPGTVVLNTAPVRQTPGSDNSKFIIGDLRSDDGGVCSWHTPGVPVRSKIAALYAGLKFNIDNQYGQLDSIKQMPLRGCSFMFKDQLPACDPTKPDPCPPIVATDLFSTITIQPLFGGDNYINRYTEKTVMPFWWNFMNGEPDGTPFDYRRYTNIPFPRYWMNTEKFRLDEMTKLFSSGFGNMSNALQNLLPSGMYHLDQPLSGIPSEHGLTGATTGTSQGETGGQGSSGPQLDTTITTLIDCECTGTGTVTVTTPPTTSASTGWTWTGGCTMTIPVNLINGIGESSTGTVTAYVTASGTCTNTNSYPLGGHDLDDFIVPGWPNGGIDLDRVNPGSPAGEYSGPGTIFIAGTYSQATNQVTIGSTDITFVSDQVNSSVMIAVTTGTTPVVTEYPMVIPQGLFTLGTSCGNLDYNSPEGSVPQPDPTDNIVLENPPLGAGSKFAVRDAFMYTHNNGVLDFFVESELNLAFRDRGEENDKRHYDKFDFTDVNALFHADIIQAGNYYKYNKQLSNKYFQTQISASWGEIQPRYYDPLVAASCWTEYPKRLIYSLQASMEERRDNWRLFLPDNRKDFKDRVTTIKGLSQLGALMLFPTLSPRLFSGIDTIQTAKSKFSIGDGGLFNKEPQNIANSDLSHEYGSCESNRSVATSPHGVFFTSQAQGKIFQYGGQALDPISNQGMKWWFNTYLPSNLLAQFPDIVDCPIHDNPLTGIGCQTVYDPNNDLVYFSKKDYSVLHDMTECVQYNACDGFVYNLSECEGASSTLVCPRGYQYNTITGLCEMTVNDQPASTTEVACNADVVIVVDSSNSIEGNDNKQNVITFLDNLVSQLFANATINGTGTDLRVGILHFGAGRSVTGALQSFTSTTTGSGSSCSGQDTMFDADAQVALTSTLSDITCWIQGPASTCSVYDDAVDCEDVPYGTDLVGGIWSGMNLLYGANSRPEAPKRLIIIADGAHGTIAGTCSNSAYNDDPVGCANASETFTDFGGDYSAGDVHLTAGTVSPATPDVSFGNIIDNYANNDPYEYVTSSDSITWMQDQIIDNTTYGNQQTYFIGFDTAQAGGEDTPTADQQTYFNKFANIGNTYYGSLLEDGTLNAIIGDVIADVCPDPEYACPDGCNLIPGSQFCECTLTVPPTQIDQTRPIELTDTTYFEDASWTVSYDPKSKAWVSFHDWHPELSFNSINHFMTTKRIALEEGICPDGYEMDDEEKWCCKTSTIVHPAQIQQDIMSAYTTITDATRADTLGNRMDIAIVMDSTRPLHTNGNLVIGQKNFVLDLLGTSDIIGQDDTNLAASMGSGGSTQVSISQWMGDGQTSNFTTLQALTSDVSLCQTAAQSITTSDVIGNYNSVVAAGNAALASGSGARQVVIVITTTKSPLCETLNTTFNSGIEVIVVYIEQYGAQLDCGVGAWQGYSECLIEQANSPEEAVCNENHFNISATANQLMLGLTVANLLEGLETVECTCATGTEEVEPFNCLPEPADLPQCIACSCLDDYELQEGDCNELDPPLCTLDECTCGEPPFPGAELSTTGTDCEHAHMPLMCTWTYEECVPPTFGYGTIWKHNVRTDLFSNYYGEDFPWEVDILQSSGQLVNTVRSIEYNLESYVYKNEGRDRFHLLDFNFDQAELYNTEQTSGLLNLVLSPKNDIPAVMLYPIINADDIDILYSKEEQKYRFNQFWDVTEDRGEFTEIQEPIYITQLNGYIRDLNIDNIDLTKEAFQRKKFRHYYNHIILRRAVSGDAKMLLRLTNTKINLSPR
jgi:hypothetical protein